MKMPCNLNKLQKGNWVKLRNGLRLVVEQVKRYHAAGLADIHFYDSNLNRTYTLEGCHLTDSNFDICEINHTKPKGLVIEHRTYEPDNVEIVGVFAERKPTPEQVLKLFFKFTPDFEKRPQKEHENILEHLSKFLNEEKSEYDIQNDTYIFHYKEITIGEGQRYSYFSEE